MQAADPAKPIPNYLVMAYLIVAVLIALAFVLRSRLSVDNPGKLQIVFEDLVGGLRGMLEDIVGPKGPTYLTLVGTVGAFILLGNLIGLVPGLHGADQQHQRHAGLRPHGVGLLPLSRA